MASLQNLFENNLAWSAAKTASDPEFFERLSKQQTPEYLWIGCADSRVPANEIVGLQPGELFVHRNVANVVVHSDLNALSVLHFAVDVLKVRHVIVCGHYGCSGVAAAFRGQATGISEYWLRHVEDVATKHGPLLEALENEGDRINYLCELNVIEQVRNVCRTSVIDAAWKRGQEVSVHGCIYGLSDGILRDLEVTTSGPEELTELRHRGYAHDVFTTHHCCSQH